MANVSPSFETILEIDLGALAQNYAYLRSKLNASTKFMAVVKAFGYGSDSGAVALKLQELGVDYFAVAYAREGAFLRDQGITKPILVLHALPANFDIIIDRCLEPNLYSKKILKAFIEYAESKEQSAYPIHLKFNTGLNRLGFVAEVETAILNILQSTSAVRVASLFSHLAASEDLSEREFTKSQISAFENISNHFIEKLGYRALRHTLNTSGILNYPEAQFEMVRSGIGLYGFGNDERFDSHLTPISTLKSVISQIHDVQEGASVGYNRAYRAKEPLKTATIPIGHADGISRIYGNGKGWVTIQGRKAPIVGNVCMDMIMVDVSEIECNEGDEVIVFGPMERADSLAEHAGTISYELITALSQRVPRIIKNS